MVQGGNGGGAPAAVLSVAGGGHPVETRRDAPVLPDILHGPGLPVKYIRGIHRYQIKRLISSLHRTGLPRIKAQQCVPGPSTNSRGGEGEKVGQNLSYSRVHIYKLFLAYRGHHHSSNTGYVTVYIYQT